MIRITCSLGSQIATESLIMGSKSKSQCRFSCGNGRWLNCCYFVLDIGEDLSYSKNGIQKYRRDGLKLASVAFEYRNVLTQSFLSYNIDLFVTWSHRAWVFERFQALSMTSTVCRFMNNAANEETTVTFKSKDFMAHVHNFGHSAFNVLVFVCVRQTTSISATKAVA